MNKETRLEYRRKYYQEHKDKNKEYNEAHKEEIKAKRKAYREAHKEEIAERNRKYRESHKAEIRESRKRHYKENAEKIKAKSQEYRDSHKEYYKDYDAQYQNERLKNDPLFKFKRGIRHVIYLSFKRRGVCKKGKSEGVLGCSVEEFKKYIESKFEEGMTFENYGKWHLDHIKPLASAKTFEEVVVLCHYANFQPLWAEENLRKGAKVD